MCLKLHLIFVVKFFQTMFVKTFDQNQVNGSHCSYFQIFRKATM